MIDVCTIRQIFFIDKLSVKLETKKGKILDLVFKNEIQLRNFLSKYKEVNDD